MKILHGEDIVSSRNKLIKMISEAKLADWEIIEFSGKDISLTDIKQAMESQSLFGQQKMVVIDGMFSRQKSKAQKEIIEYLILGNFETSKLILWEPKQLTASQLKGFDKKGIEEFKLPVVIFKFIDSISPASGRQNLQLFEEVLATQPEEMVFGMLIKRLRYLIVAKGAGSQGLSGFKELRDWQMKRIISQANRFTTEQLIKLQEDLLSMDYGRKSGRSSLSLRVHLELILGEL